MKPVRLQLSRRAGFNLQKLSLATNGLPAVNCARPSRFGNPFKVGVPIVKVNGLRLRPAITLNAAQAVLCFDIMTMRRLSATPDALEELRGKNLACWCKDPGGPCHVDVLLELANARRII